jgi:hypothetical protein
MLPEWPGESEINQDQNTSQCERRDGNGLRSLPGPNRLLKMRFGVISEVRPEPMALAGIDPEIVTGRD